MIHRSKLKRKINNDIVTSLFHGWRFNQGRGYPGNDGIYYNERTIVDSDKKNSITFYISENKIDYWTVNKSNKKHTQMNINEFIRVCKTKYNINFKLKSKERIV